MMLRERRLHRRPSLARRQPWEPGWIEPRAVQPPQFDRNRADEADLLRKRPAMQAVFNGLVEREQIRVSW